MDKACRDKFEKLLRENLSQLEALSSTLKAATATVTLDQTSVGRLSRMDAIQGQQMALESERRRQLEIRNIKAALKRIASDDFGYCLNCGEEIPEGRLTINPAVRHCVECVD